MDETAGWRSAESGDLTARARVRNAAVELFGARGAGAVSMRDVASAAGVSLGLVQHHFGSKDQLRAACDEYTMRFVRDAVRDGLVGGDVADADFVATMHRTGPPMLRYLSRMIIEGGDGGAALFDELFAVTRERLHADSELPDEADVEAVAAVLTAMKLGISTLHEQLIRTLGSDDPKTWERLGRAVLTIIAPAVTGVQTPAMRQGLDTVETGKRRPRKTPKKTTRHERES